jgi:hypothetical protein
MPKEQESDTKHSPLAALKRSSRWLSAFTEKVYSQTGEDGPIAKALSVLPATDHWCVEFGAWDGKYLSNTYNLVENHNYTAVLIEGDEAKYRELCSNYPFQDRGIFVHQLVGWSREDGLDSILGKHPIPHDFDLLSVDVDGNDFHIWQAMKEFRPKLVLIEYNCTASNRFDFVQPADPNLNQGSSPAALVRLGKEKGYELIWLNRINLLFVDSQYFSLFNIPDNSLAVMRDEDDVTSLFHTYDGKLLLDGPAMLLWHYSMAFSIQQPLPKIFRHPENRYNWLQRLLFKLYSRLHRRSRSSGTPVKPE